MKSLSLQTRTEIVAMVTSGITISQTALHFGTTRDTVIKWCQRFDDGGEEALLNRSSVPHSTPHAISDGNRDLIIKTALEHPQRGIQWLSKKLKIVSPSTIQNILNDSELGHKKERLEHLFNIYRECGEEALSESRLIGMSKISTHFRLRNYLYKIPGKSFFMITIKQPVQRSRRMYELIFFIDRFDMSVSCVIDSREFWDYDMRKTLQQVCLQHNMTEGSSHRLSPNVLAWNHFIVKSNSDNKVSLILPFSEKSIPKHLRVLSRQIQPLNISISVLPSPQLHAIPFIRNFLDQFKEFRKSTLNQGIYLRYREGHQKPVLRCEGLVQQFVNNYNGKIIPTFPHFGSSPNEYPKKNVKHKSSEPNSVARLQQVLRTLDRSKPLLKLPTISESIDLAMRLADELDEVYVNENQLELDFENSMTMSI